MWPGQCISCTELIDNDAGRYGRPRPLAANEDRRSVEASRIWQLPELSKEAIVVDSASEENLGAVSREDEAAALCALKT